MKAVFAQLQRISANDPGLERAANICDESLVDSMKLEEVRGFLKLRLELVQLLFVLSSVFADHCDLYFFQL